MKHGSLFSGIGGFDLAAEWMGWENIFHCEWNSFGQKVLKHYWPNAISYNDITKTDFSIHRGQIDILTGGFPCQPYSSAGKRKGKEDERHLWPEMLRAIREIQPSYVVGENVRGLTNWNGGMVFDEVQADLETQGFEILPFLLPACAVNAPHRRDRIWFIAHSISTGKRKLQPTKSGANSSKVRCKNSCGFECTCSNESVANPKKNDDGYTQQKRWPPFKSGNGIGSTDGNWKNFPTQSPICLRNDGLSERLDGITFPKWREQSIMAAGNAIVPQVAYQIFKAIQETN